jgi:putative FmdB family regulatory protein
MPTYEYVCQSCGRHVDVFQRFIEDALTTCEVCGGSLRKVFHPAGIHFKGSGFYATDSRRSSKTSSGDKEGDRKSEKGEKKKDTGSKTPESSGSSGSDSSSSGSSSKGDSSSDSSSTGGSSKGDSSKSREKSA